MPHRSRLRPRLGSDTRPMPHCHHLRPGFTALPLPRRPGRHPGPALLLLLAALLPTVALAHHSRSPVAPVVAGIVPDGRLDDWPAEVPRYSFDRSDLTADQRRSYQVESRPGAWWMTAWDPEGQRLYVAVQVEDDDLVVGRDWNTTDGIEIYVSGLDGGSGSQPVQWVMIPRAEGPGLAPTIGYHMRRDANPPAAGTSRYDGHAITYECALQVFDGALNRPARLTAGEQLAFDLVVLDRTSQGGHRWTPWGRPEITKYLGLDRVGRVTLSDQRLPAGWWARALAWLREETRVEVRLGALAAGILGVLAVVGYTRRRGRQGAMEARLGQIERRLTDTQEVMLALSEKLDGLEGHLDPDAKDG